jgi:hypothetical protein
MHLQVKAAADEITVADPASHRFVTYHKPQGSPQLIEKRISDNGLALSAPQFLANAWRLANEKARVAVDCLKGLAIRGGAFFMGTTAGQRSCP